MTEPAWKSGDPWCICDVCGFQYRTSQMRTRWDNLKVCPSDWEPRHPQEFVRGRKDKIAVMNARPEPPPKFIEPGDVTAEDL